MGPCNLSIETLFLVICKPTLLETDGSLKQVYEYIRRHLLGRYNDLTSLGSTGHVKGDSLFMTWPTTESKRELEFRDSKFYSDPQIPIL